MTDLEKNQVAKVGKMLIETRIELKKLNKEQLDLLELILEKNFKVIELKNLSEQINSIID